MTSDLSPTATDTVEQLEQEGDVAADFLEGLLDIADIGGDLALDVRNDRAYVSIESDGDDSLRVLADPDTVSALQDLTRLAVQNRTGRFSRLILDVSGSRDARRRELEALVDMPPPAWRTAHLRRRSPRCRATSARSSMTSQRSAGSSRSPTVRVRSVTRCSVARECFT